MLTRSNALLIQSNHKLVEVNSRLEARQRLVEEQLAEARREMVELHECAHELEETIDRQQQDSDVAKTFIAKQAIMLAKINGKTY